MNRNIVAILRGITPAQAPAIGVALVEAGVTMIEVPLNSPDALDSIAALQARFGGIARIGAGTVLRVDQVQAVARTGACLIVSPNCDAAVIGASKAAGLLSFPGVMTPTEAFAAIAAGADALKLFPGELVGPAGLRAMRAVLPPHLPLYAVGGVSTGNMAEWCAAGATGFGIGSALYKPGDTAAVVADKARAVIAAWDALA
ncbi:2-dehydro-3-deoxy-6-phosphogalactonate aldolase [Paracoccus salsus]|uniref:2-dehydro-3-deoxy-6-phosphogalactonate aldolase n=1 Tax=Paracoccus salsus TaxID=2911061 RepID=UPI001F3933CF|nr:2-dehydro-3-deoxy-6-phosphogalactonate aldolase [Paracoccus salsus]MCF3972414.1 2-dehydro-3-deoxy-6-phosphogalactonate aldolase [Paracoccus salsus]